MFELLLNAEVYAPEPLGVQNVLVCAGKIVYLGSERPTLGAPLNVSLTDLGGKRLIPGLIDCHAHITGGGGEAGARTIVPPPALSQYSSAGVTTVVGLLGTDDHTRSTASLVARVRGLREEGLSAYCYTGGYHLPPTTLTGSIRGDIADIDCIIGFGELAISDHRSSQPTFDEVIRVASETHVGGLMTGKAGILHLHLGDGNRGLDLIRRALAETELPPRTFHPTHVNRRKALFEEACELARQGCTIDVTAFPVDETATDEWSAAEALTRYLDAGLPPGRITISSDGGGCLPVFDRQGELLSMDFARAHALAETLQELLGAGRSLAAILPSFTSNVARLLRFHDKGYLAPGADADLVVLDEAHRIHSVMVQGRWHVRNGEIEVRGTFE